MTNIPGQEHIPRWMSASAFNLVTTQTCPHPVWHLLLDRNGEERQKARRYIEFWGEFLNIEEISNSEYVYTFAAKLIATAMQDDDNLFWPENVLGWAIALLQPCFEIRSHAMIVNSGPVTKTGNNTSLGQARRSGSRTVEHMNPLDGFSRSTVTAVYTWEHTCRTLASAL